MEIQPIYYYVRYPNRKPMITVCLLRLPDGRIARGVAVCSDKDQPVKAKGRELAYGRALFMASGNGVPVWTNALAGNPFFKHKAYSFADISELSVFEQMRIARIDYRREKYEKKQQAEQNKVVAMIEKIRLNLAAGNEYFRISNGEPLPTDIEVVKAMIEEGGVKEIPA